jgi:hypothetical protein
MRDVRKVRCGVVNCNFQNPLDRDFTTISILYKKKEDRGI